VFDAGARGGWPWPGLAKKPKTKKPPTRFSSEVFDPEGGGFKTPKPRRQKVQDRLGGVRTPHTPPLADLCPDSPSMGAYGKNRKGKEGLNTLSKLNAK
jgi:hypothetical protein